MALIQVSYRIIYSISIAILLSISFNIITVVITIADPYIHGTSLPGSLPLTQGLVALTYSDEGYKGFKTSDDWEALYPPGKGFVKIRGSYYLVSLYHQMHCVNAFRRSMEDYWSGKRNSTNIPTDHLTHCLSYLRQSILCNADTALEPAHIRMTVNGEIVHSAYGDGTTHECRDWREVYRWVEANHDQWKDEDDFEVL